MRAYSYIRFSSAKQASGDSLRRQTTLASEYAFRNGLELDEALTYRDLGVSAFDSSNAETGALSIFIAAVKNGRVPTGSFLLVEQLDRLSRADVYTAFTLFQTLLQSGITVVTLSPEQVYSKNSSRDLGSLMMVMASMHRAHEESAGKSVRLRKSWGNKRARREAVMTRECPRWLTPRDDRSGFDVIPEKAESVRRVFELSIAGFGAVRIVRKANSEGWPVPGISNTWHNSLVVRILKNQAVLGRFCPQAIDDNGVKKPTGEVWENYYPRIVSDETFRLAEASKASKLSIPARRDSNYRNLFQGILKCGICGASFIRKNKNSEKQKGYAIYMCGNRVRGLTKCPSENAANLEWRLLSRIYADAYEHVSSQDDLKQMQNEIALLKQNLDNAHAKVARLADAIAETDSPSLVARLPKAEEEERALTSELKASEVKLASFTASLFDKEHLMLRTLPDDFDRIQNADEIQFRSELREKLLRLIEYAFVFPESFAIVLKYRHSSVLAYAPLSAQYDSKEMPYIKEYLNEQKFLPE